MFLEHHEVVVGFDPSADVWSLTQALHHRKKGHLAAEASNTILLSCPRENMHILLLLAFHASTAYVLVDL